MRTIIIFKTENIRFVSGHTNVLIYTKPNRTQWVYDHLLNMTKINGNYTVYLKKDIPTELHIKNNSRAPDILLLPEPGWTVTTDLRDPPYLKGNWERGDHGYDNKHMAMNPAFFAYGPSFKINYKMKSVNTVDMYLLIAHILNLSVTKQTDGSWDRIEPVLKVRDEKDRDNA